MQFVASAHTDRQGAFSFGNLALDTEVRFPLETARRFEYLVTDRSGQLSVDGVTFVAPRAGGAVASVAASIRLR